MCLFTNLTDPFCCLYLSYFRSLFPNERTVLCLSLPAGLDSNQPGFAHVKGVYGPMGSVMHRTLLIKKHCEPLFLPPLWEMPADFLEWLSSRCPDHSLCLYSNKKVVLYNQPISKKVMISKKGSHMCFLHQPHWIQKSVYPALYFKVVSLLLK